MGFRPWDDVLKVDLAAEIEAGIYDYVNDATGFWEGPMECWVAMRMYAAPGSDPVTLRKYYIRRAYREAAPDMEKFYFTLQRSYYEDPREIDYEDSNELRTAQWALWAPPTRKSLFGGPANLAEELTGYLDDAVKHVRHPTAKLYVEQVRTHWLDYLAKAKTFRAKAFGTR